jgi:hypothetical protein
VGRRGCTAKKGQTCPQELARGLGQALFDEGAEPPQVLIAVEEADISVAGAPGPEVPPGAAVPAGALPLRACIRPLSAADGAVTLNALSGIGCPSALGGAPPGLCPFFAAALPIRSAAVLV